MTTVRHAADWPIRGQAHESGLVAKLAGRLVFDGRKRYVKT